MRRAVTSSPLRSARPTAPRARWTGVSRESTRAHARLRLLAALLALLLLGCGGGGTDMDGVTPPLVGGDDALGPPPPMALREATVLLLDNVGRCLDLMHDGRVRGPVGDAAQRSEEMATETALRLAAERLRAENAPVRAAEAAASLERLAPTRQYKDDDVRSALADLWRLETKLCGDRAARAAQMALEPEARAEGALARGRAERRVLDAIDLPPPEIRALRVRFAPQLRAGRILGADGAHAPEPPSVATVMRDLQRLQAGEAGAESARDADGGRDPAAIGQLPGVDVDAVVASAAADDPATADEAGAEAEEEMAPVKRQARIVWADPLKRWHADVYKPRILPVKRALARVMTVPADIVDPAACAMLARNTAIVLDVDDHPLLSSPDEQINDGLRRALDAFRRAGDACGSGDRDRMRDQLSAGEAALGDVAAQLRPRGMDL
ncbi:MAG: hypothetical protein AAF772_06825 [Acidobacteriota bacterium]